eukprot:6194909-Pleurochrysis_carterae.AAC.2
MFKFAGGFAGRVDASGAGAPVAGSAPVLNVSTYLDRVPRRARDAALGMGVVMRESGIGVGAPPAGSSSAELDG